MSTEPLTATQRVIEAAREMADPIHGECLSGVLQGAAAFVDPAHQSYVDSLSGGDACGFCDDNWPCDTEKLRRALEDFAAADLVVIPRTVLDDLVGDMEDCEPDHAGGCHGYALLNGEECPVKVAKEALERRP